MNIWDQGPTEWSTFVLSVLYIYGKNESTRVDDLQSQLAIRMKLSYLI